MRPGKNVYNEENRLAADRLMEFLQVNPTLKELL